MDLFGVDVKTKSSQSLRTIVKGLFALLVMNAFLYAANAPVTVSWQTLKTLTSAATAQKSPAFGLQGKDVSIPGFMVPLEDDDNEVTEFLLVPYAGACIHTPPPPPEPDGVRKDGSRFQGKDVLCGPYRCHWTAEDLDHRKSLWRCLLHAHG